MAFTWRRKAVYSFQYKRKEGARGTMRNPENVLNSLQKHSNSKDYTYNRLYRNIFNRNLFLQAYQNIYSKQGNMTAGTDGKTIDAMSIERIDRITNAMELRKFGCGKKRTWILERKFNFLDYFALALGILFICYSLYYNISNGSRYFNPFI